MNLELLNILDPATTFLSGSPANRKLQILIYHRILAEKDPLQPSEPTVEEFRWQADLLARHFNVLPLTQAIALLHQGKLPPRAACITFDDGYADNFTLALPVLQELSLPATIFVATGFLDGGIMFNDVVLECVRQFDEVELDLRPIELQGRYPCSQTVQKRATIANVINQLKYLPGKERSEKADYLAELTGTILPTELMMTGGQLQATSNAGIDIGAHTVNHPILKNLDDPCAHQEIEQSRVWLEKFLDKHVELFAYPNGVPGKDYAGHHPMMLKEMGFKAAVSTAPGYSTSSTNRYELHRFTPWDKSKNRFFIRLLKNYL